MTKPDAMTAVQAVDSVALNRLVLPGIQRSFVWNPKQLATLFDSLFNDYPIGSVLLWRMKPGDHPELRFRKLVTDYRGQGTRPKPVKPPKTSAILAILDGQQRLTALNIGLNGSHSTSEHGSPRYLYIDLDYSEEDEGTERPADRFDFRQDGVGPPGCAWFRVCDARGLPSDAASLSSAIQKSGHQATTDRRRALKKLVRVINADLAVKVEIETTNDLDRVLNVFARTNMGGTNLTFVELLVSTATARWKTLDAFEEINELRRRMNSAAIDEFRFTTDRIVKAGIVLLDTPEPKFSIAAFAKKATKLEDIWPEFCRSMEVASGLLASFGLSGRSLPAENVVIPLAYYAHHRQLGPNYVTQHKYEKDRHLVRAFVARTLLQRRYWTGVVDPVLVETRKTIRLHGNAGFPLAAIEARLQGVKPINNVAALVEELLDLRKADRRTLSLLCLLFPHMINDGRGGLSLDKDHIFPISKCTESQFTRVGVHQDDCASLIAMADRLPNLQLLRHDDNIKGSKGVNLPKDWFGTLTATSKRRYTLQDVKYVPDTLAGFESFWRARRARLQIRIERLLQP